MTVKNGVRLGLSGSLQDPTARTAIALRLRARRTEVESAITARVAAVSEPPRHDAEYRIGLQAAISSAIEHGLATLEAPDDTQLPTPDALIAQARLAARAGVALGTVLRRYFGGYTLLLDFIVAEARESASIDGEALQSLVRSQGLVHDQVVAAVSEAYAREPRPRFLSIAERRAVLVRKLLGGELLDSGPLGYEIERNRHLGVLASGPAGNEALRSLAVQMDCPALVVCAEPEIYWGWFGVTSSLVSEEVAARARRLPPVQEMSVMISLGEPALGAPGWRLTHRQANAAMAMAAARGRAGRTVRYVDVALAASLSQDDLLADSLRAIYLRPLSEEKDGGKAARRILRAYLRAERNISSAAAGLGLNRQTVAKRLQMIDERLGGALRHRGADLELALLVDDLDGAGG